MLNNFYISVFTVEDCSEIPSLLSEWSGETLEYFIFTKEQVEYKLKSLRPASSPGPDNIHPKILRDLAPAICQPLAMLF